MKTRHLLITAVQAAAALSLAACASNPRTVARESSDYDGELVSSRGPSATSDEDLRQLRGGREQTQTTSSSTTRELVSSRGPSATSDEDLRQLRGGREQTQTTSSSTTQVNRAGEVKARSSDTEVIDTVTETVVEMAPVADGNEDF